MADAKDSGFFMSKRDVGEVKDRSGSRAGGDDFDAKGSKQIVSDLDEDDTVLSDDPKPPRRASVGWGNESGGDDKLAGAASGGAPSGSSTGGATAESKRPGRRRKGGDASSTSGTDPKAKNRHFDEDNEATDIVEIPDLEEEEREPDITMQVAEAPRNTTRSVQSLKELDRDIKFSLPNAAAFGVDLSLLTSCLCPEKAVIESDDNWNFDSLLNEVSQEMQKDVDEREEMLKAEGA